MSWQSCPQIFIYTKSGTIPVVLPHTDQAQQHKPPKHNYATIFSLFCILFFFIFVPFPWLKLLSNGQHRDRKEFGIRLKPVALFANLPAASSVLVRWPISWLSDRGSLTVAIKTHTRRCTHAHTRRRSLQTHVHICVHTYIQHTVQRCLRLSISICCFCKMCA